MHSASPPALLPGSWLGLLGGGQLGRMFAMSAQRMGYRVAVLDPAQDSPAGDVADCQICADYLDPAGLEQLAGLCAAVTTEFENVPAQSLEFLAGHVPVRPGAASVAIAQDRLSEKNFIRGCGIETAPHAAVHCAADLERLPAHLFPGILKASRLGYDGKGQARVANVAEAQAAFAEMAVPCVLEQRLQLEFEISVVLARGADGEIISFPVAENAHDHGILAVSSIPAPSASAELRAEALHAARRIAERLEYVGVLCVEFFVVGGKLLVNEMAPRPHNSGHYSMDACVVSQFDAQVLALTGMPLAMPRQHSPAVMLNLLGDLWFPAGATAQVEPDWAAVLRVPGAKLHLYGKREARPGRKMGHITVVAENAQQARANAVTVAQAINLPASWIG